jgi:hypothetical protein
MTTASDDFNRANETPIAAPWAAIVGGGANLTSNALASTAGTEKLSYYNSGTWGNNQEAEGVVGNLSESNNYAELLVRSGASGNGYSVYTDGVSGAGHTEIARYDGGTPTVLQSIATTFANGDTLKIGVVGTTITMYKNGAAQTPTATDATYASGNPGAGGFGAATIDNFSATDGAGGGSVRPPMYYPRKVFFPV